MTKKVLNHAAALVKSIRDGKWTNERPAWGVPPGWTIPQRGRWFLVDDWDRAAMTAEAFILLARTFDPRFNETRFLIACGLLERPATKGRRA